MVVGRGVALSSFSTRIPLPFPSYNIYFSLKISLLPLSCPVIPRQQSTVPDNLFLPTALTLSWPPDTLSSQLP